MLVREPAVAGGFYPSSGAACLREIESLGGGALPEGLPERPVGGIVPHAGWVYSGATALRVFEAIKSRRSPRAFVLFGTIHGPLRRPAMFTTGGWRTPLGLVEVDERLAGEILSLGGGLVRDDPVAHENEHSLEVQLPFLQHLFPGAKIVPIALHPTSDAPEIGRTVARAIRALDADAVCIGSTDLTHYGERYGFAPRGTGEAALRWMREENDKRMVDLMTRLDAEAIVPEASERWNACAPGAVAAALAAAAALGASRGHLVEYTTSYDVMRAKTGRADASLVVGYAGIVF